MICPYLTTCQYKLNLDGCCELSFEGRLNRCPEKIYKKHFKNN